MKRFYQFLATFTDGVRLVCCRAYSYEEAVSMFPDAIDLKAV